MAEGLFGGILRDHEEAPAVKAPEALAAASADSKRGRDDA